MTKHLILGLLVATLVATPLAGQSGPAPAARAAEPAPAGRVVEEGSDAIRPGDVVRLTVFRSDSLSGEYPVNQFGTVVLPIIGEYDVNGETHWTLREKVIHDLQEVRYAPAIEVVVLKKVRVMGAVNEPGVYSLEPTMTVADAVAMASGVAEFGNEGEIVLRRGADVLDADLRLGTLISESPLRSGDEIFVPRRSFWERNLPAIVAGGTAVFGIMVSVLLR